MSVQTMNRRQVLAMLGMAGGALATGAAVFANGGGDTVTNDVYGTDNEECPDPLCVYETVAVMKQDLSLANGDCVVTQGYYEANDGGGAAYRIGSAGEEPLDNGLSAQLFVNGTVDLRMFGCKLDYQTDDWANINRALQYCRDHFLRRIVTTHSAGIKLSAPLVLDIPGLVFENIGYKTCQISPSEAIDACLVLKANTVLKNFIVNGLNAAIDNIALEDAKDSIFENVETKSAKRFGLVSRAVGNNNSVKLTNFRAASNGTLYDQVCQYISESTTTNDTVVEIPGLDFVSGYCKLTRYVEIFGDIYILKEVVNATTVKLYPRLPQKEFANQPIKLYCGAGIEIQKHGDNGIWLGNFVACVGNVGVGIRINSLYGHQFNDFSSEFNQVAGLSVGDRISNDSQTYSSVFIKPYFENASNHYDLIVEKCSGFTIIEPVLNLDHVKTYTPSLSYKEMTILKTGRSYEYINLLTSPGVTHSLEIGQQYIIRASASGNFTVTLPAAKQQWYKQAIQLHIAGMTGDLIVNAASGETIQGQSSYTWTNAGQRIVTLLVVLNGQWVLL